MVLNDLAGNEMYTFEKEDSFLVVKISNVPPSLELIADAVDQLHTYVNGEKIKLLVDPGQGIALNTEQRKFLISNLEKTSRAIAVINTNWIVVLVHGIVVRKDKPEFKLKLVKDYEAGKKWLDSLD